MYGRNHRQLMAEPMRILKCVALDSRNSNGGLPVKLQIGEKRRIARMVET